MPTPEPEREDIRSATLDACALAMALQRSDCDGADLLWWSYRELPETSQLVKALTALFLRVVAELAEVTGSSPAEVLASLAFSIRVQ